MLDQLLAQRGKPSNAIPQAQLSPFGIHKFKVVVSSNGNEVDALFGGAVVKALTASQRISFSPTSTDRKCRRCEASLEWTSARKQKHRSGHERKGKNLEAVVGMAW